jgi:tRNA wybutosine-synthesizing protein 1
MMEPLDLLSLPTELLLLWHNYRLEILLSAGAVVVCVNFVVQWRKRRSKVVLSPLQSPIEEKHSTLSRYDTAEADHYTPNPAITQPGLVTKAGPKRVTGTRRARKSPTNPPLDGGSEENVKIQPLIFYFSLGGSTKVYAEQLRQSILTRSSEKLLEPIAHDLTEIDYDDFFVTPPKSQSDTKAKYFYLLVIPSYDISTELDNFLDHLKETHHDFRIDTAPLSNLAGYCVFGLGDQQEWPTEKEGFGKDGVAVDRWMAKLTGGKRAFPLGVADVRQDVEARLAQWKEGIQDMLVEVQAGRGLGEGVAGSGEALESGDEDEEVEEDRIAPSGARRKQVTRTRTDDLEDLRPPVPVDFTTTISTPKAMVPTTSPTYTSLTKQGYTIVGTHSGVKTCRWTKSALRGRGSCYKFSFYGIASHLCMEATPSLSCSNKCVFCWRHGTNPVSTTWRWQVDDPEEVFQGMKTGHYRKIKAMKGVPGVRAERFSEAMQIRHCALSLVGEPIFYPRINELLALLHGEKISTFLVCNAQHPDHLARLDHVTQLYVSIDASNAESLKRIDRPLHRDYWARFLRCMDILREKRFQQRTVFRLTLVKGFNIDEEAEGYADLVQRALPSFVEVKGVTYCGTSTSQGAGLSMQNVPFYEEVSAFVLALEAALKRRNLDYGIAAEHAHSCCILLADRGRYFRPSEDDGVPRWHTLIDYGKFSECLEKGEEFGPEDYIGKPTPEWALWGRGGFDPRDERVDRKGRPKAAVTIANE